MNAKKCLGFIMIISILLALIPNGSASAGATKVDVCHLDGMGVYHLINISANAFDAHVAHGDAAPGKLVPGMTGKKFAPDCSVIDVKTLVDTIIVPSTGTVVFSTAVLENGVVYELKASGTYKFTNWTNAGIADARCSLRIPGSYNNTGAIAWIDGNVFPGVLQYYLQVWAGGSHVAWGTACDLTHIYIGSFTGSGTTVNFKIWDTNYGDNSGNIVVKIYRYN